MRAGDSYAYAEDLTTDRARDVWMDLPPGLTVVDDHDGFAVVGTVPTVPRTILRSRPQWARPR